MAANQKSRTAATQRGRQIRAEIPSAHGSERGEWRAVACALALLLCAFGGGWLYTERTTGVALGWPVGIAYGIALGWLARALIGWWRGNASAMDVRALTDFRHRNFWSRPARWSYAALLVCDGLFLLDLNPEAPVMFFILAGLSAAFAVEVGVLSIVLGTFQLL